MQRGYIDFYGYNKDIYEQLTRDFMDCIAELSPIRDVHEPRHQTQGPWNRHERVIWVTGRPDFGMIVERMKGKGYNRYQHYNLYDHSLEDWLAHSKGEVVGEFMSFPEEWLPKPKCGKCVIL